MDSPIRGVRKWRGRSVVSVPSVGLGYGAAVAAALVALGIRWALDPVLGEHSPYLPSALAVIVAAWFGGRGPGFAALALSALGIEFLLIEPRFSLAIADSEALAGLALFVVVGSLISVLVGNLRHLHLASARAEEAAWRKAQLVDLSHDAIISADAAGRITGWNAGAEEMYGWTEAEAVGQSIHDLLRTGGGISPAAVEEILHREGRWDGELSHTVRDGRVLFVESRQKLVRDESNLPVGILEINRDLTARKRAEAQLLAEHRKNAAILESISDGFTTLDRDWRHTYVNPPGAKMVGKSPEEMLGKVIWELWPQAADSPYGAACRRAVAENIPVQVEACYPGPLNRWFDVRCYPSTEGLSLFFTDTTDRRHADDRLRQAQKLQSIGLLAGGVAHDFNNILTVIMGNAGAALSACPTCEHSQAILAASERAAYLTRQLLAYAGKGRIVAKAVDLTELVSRSKDLLTASVPKRVSLAFRLSPDLPCLEADPSQIEQILMNLVINAGEAIPLRSDGLIEIATSGLQVTAEMAARHPHAHDVATGAYVCLEVRDNGQGMDEATVSRVFDPFFTTKFTGRGLGLAALDGIVRTAKGFVEVDSLPGRGTTFRVFLPASGVQPPVERASAAPRRQLDGGATILVVDDEEMVRKLACVILRRHGYDVLEAHDGKDALRLLAESGVLPSLALIDLAMPVMGGDELAPILGAKYPEVKVVLSSGYPEDEARKLSPNGCIASFLQKPYTGVALAEKIAQVLEQG